MCRYIISFYILKYINIDFNLISIEINLKIIYIINSIVCIICIICIIYILYLIYIKIYSIYTIFL